MVNGVFPDPPTERLPTLTTGNRSRRTGSSPLPSRSSRSANASL
jgi:hypothetical protein